jgi:Tol biopolymer transport system component
VRARLVALTLLAGAAVASPAPAAQLTYTCGAQYEDICLSAPNGADQRRFSRDGRPGTDHTYRAPELSPDGRRLGYVVDSDLFIRDLRTGEVAHAVQQNSPLLIRFRDDGARFAVGEIAAVLNSTSLCSYNTDLSGRNEGRYCIATGISSGFDYLPDGRLAIARGGGTATAGRSVISLLRPEDGGPTGVERDLLVDPVLNLESPAVSPDGRLAAVVRTASGTRGEIALYDLTTGALLRRLTTAPSDGAPAFAPDGSAVAFDRDRAGGRSIWVVSVRGGKPRRVVSHGRSPSWGGGGLVLRGASKRARPAQLARGLRLRVSGAARGTTLAAVLTSHGALATDRGRGTLVLRVGSAAIARLGARATLRLTVSVRQPGLPPARLSRSIAFRR